MTSLSSPHQLSPQPSILQYANAGTPQRSTLDTAITPQMHHSSSQDDLSSSDKENSPANSYVSRNSNNIILEKMDGSLSFTPRRLKNLPRAWERRPATPYVPRNEGQKIWKRIPLGELAGGHSNIQESKRNRESKEDYVRAVKKMKVDEAASRITLGKESASVGTRWEEENIEKGGSPKKKAQLRSRKIPEDHNIEVGTDLVEEQGEEFEKVEDLLLERANSIDMTEDEEKSLHLDREGATSSSIVREQALSESDPEPHNEVDDNADSISLESGKHDADDLPDHVLRPTSSYGIEAVSDAASESGKTQDVDSSVTNEEETQDTLHGGSSISFSHSASGNDEIVPMREDTRNTEPDTKPIDVESSPVSGNPAESGLESSHTSLINSPLEEETVNELSSGTPTDSEASLFSSSQSESMPVSTRSMKTFVGTDSEETAFLHDFLIRARASKVARTTIGLLNSDGKTLQITDEASTDKVDEQDPLALDDIEESEPTAKTRQSVVDENTTETTISSPVRRSARTAVVANTKPSRPQTLSLVPQFGPVLPSQNLPLPNTIQLKRATGTEFIFNAKIQQTLAMTTRANTKRNQGTSVNVMTRLEQLKSAIVNAEEDDQQKGSLLTLISVDIPSPGKINASKKRKRVKNDEVSKFKKSVRWNEELASYLDPAPASPESKPTCNDFAEIEAAAQAEALISLTNNFTFPKPVPSDLTDSLAEADPAKKLSEPVLEVKVDESDSAESSKHKVRKLRKVNIGSVNGTPAPKTRSQSSRLTPHSSSNSSTSSIPKLGSRMPVPTSRGSHALKNLPNSMSEQQSRKQDEGDKKLAARRNLRARS